MILVTGEEWGIFCGALPVLGRSALVRLRKGSGCGGLKNLLYEIALKISATRSLLSRKRKESIVSLTIL